MAGLGRCGVACAKRDRSLEPAKRWSAAADGLASSPTCSGTTTRLGAVVAALVFGGLDMLQIQLQTVGINVPNRLVNLFPYAGVILVLTIWGTTRTPSAVGEPYESEE